ncbi:hypothetical protein AOB57_000260 [Methanosarcina flavescens]|uniref:Uncharacterized protein n=1 Tax=Methanosarcina flavescens TaxID=1715806 RepID=A0A660HNJ9_9EURY|nr:hypothetical protein AOB57_000260 [Methanosarcina flavescens]
MNEEKLTFNQKIPSKVKKSPRSKKALQNAPYKDTKSGVFQCHFFQHHLNERIRVRFKQTAGRKNIFQLNWKQENFFRSWRSSFDSFS